MIPKKINIKAKAIKPSPGEGGDTGEHYHELRAVKGFIQNTESNKHKRKNQIN